MLQIQIEQLAINDIEQVLWLELGGLALMNLWQSNRPTEQPTDQSSNRPTDRHDGVIGKKHFQQNQIIRILYHFWFQGLTKEEKKRLRVICETGSKRLADVDLALIVMVVDGLAQDGRTNLGTHQKAKKIYI